MDRIHLCGSRWNKVLHQDDPEEAQPVNWDFTSCLFINQLVTTNKTDNMRGFNKTVEYCSDMWGVDLKGLYKCASTDWGTRVLAASHAREMRNNPSTPHINWIVVDGKNYANDEHADWQQIVCDAYTGPKPDSCK